MNAESLLRVSEFHRLVTCCRLKILYYHMHLNILRQCDCMTQDSQVQIKILEHLKVEDYLNESKINSNRLANQSA